MQYIFASDTRYMRRRMLFAALALFGDLILYEIHGADHGHVGARKVFRTLQEGKAAALKPARDSIRSLSERTLKESAASLVRTALSAFSVVEASGSWKQGELRTDAEFSVFEALHKEAVRLKTDASIGIILHDVRSKVSREEASLKLNAAEIYGIVDELAQLED